MNWKKKDEVKIEQQETKKWYPVFHEIDNTEYMISFSRRSSFKSWDRIGTSYEYVILDNVKHYECSPDEGAHIYFFPETSLKFPQKPDEVESK